VKPPAVPPALAGLLQLIGMDLKEVLGNSDNAQEVVSNISAKAVELIQNRLDMQNFIYMDNFKKSMRRCGEIWLSMARDLYDEENREMRVVNLDGSDEVAMLRAPSVDGDQDMHYINDPSSGKFKVIADVGPSFTTRRDGTVRAITGMMQYVEDPADKAVLAGVAIQNLEGEGLADVKSYFRRKSIDMGVTKPTEDEAKEIAEAKAAQAQQPPDAQTQFLLAEAEKSLAKAAEAEANTALLLQKVQESEARVAEIIAKIEQGELADVLKVLQSDKEEQAPAATAVPA
jgi:Phage P22-like portal protein